MNTRIKLAGLAISLASLLVATNNCPAQVSFTAGLEISSPADFYSPLTPYGGWIDVVPYGRCWRPYDVATGWRPYSTGYWEWTDCGWYWVSDEPWSWACYHYGSWVYDSFYGWVWVPGVEWAPAWVVWRESPEYIGWAPCGPAGFTVAPSFFLFVDVHRFHDRIRPGVFVVNDPRIIRETRFVNNITRTTRTFDGTPRRVVINQGPSVAVVQRATGTRLTPRPIREVVAHTPAPATVPRTRLGTVYERPALPAPRVSPTTRQPGTSTGVVETPNRRERLNSPSATGRESSRPYTQPPPATAPTTPRQQAPATPSTRPEPRRESTPPPTFDPRRGAAQAPVYTTPPVPRSATPPVYTPPQAPPRAVPGQEPRTMPPTGREVPRAYPQPPGLERREQVVPAPAPVQVPPQQVPPPVPPPRERRDNRDRSQ